MNFIKSKTLLLVWVWWLISIFLVGYFFTNSQDIILSDQQLLEEKNILELSTEQKQVLAYLLEEEKLAKDVYTTLYNEWWNKKFANILKSETQHQSKIKDIADKYNILNSLISDKIWVFQNQELSELYQQLINQWTQNEMEALKVGVIIEEKDIEDIKNMITLFPNHKDIVNVLQSLLEGSYRHLEAFQK